VKIYDCRHISRVRQCPMPQTVWMATAWMQPTCHCGEVNAWNITKRTWHRNSRRKTNIQYTKPRLHAACEIKPGKDELCIVLRRCAILRVKDSSCTQTESSNDIKIPTKYIQCFFLLPSLHYISNLSFHKKIKSKVLLPYGSKDLWDISFFFSACLATATVA